MANAIFSAFRHEERIESLHEKLEDAKMALQGVKVITFKSKHLLMISQAFVDLRYYRTNAN